MKCRLRTAGPSAERREPLVRYGPHFGQRSSSAVISGASCASQARSATFVSAQS